MRATTRRTDTTDGFFDRVGSTLGEGFEWSAPQARSSRAITAGLAAVIALVGASEPVSAQQSCDSTPKWVSVEDPGNVPDTTTFGAVVYRYQISKYEITNSQYAEFLNAVAAVDPHSLFDDLMESNSWVASNESVIPHRTATPRRSASNAFL